jgi:GxxExxY protein
MKTEQLTYLIRGAIFDVFRELGPGLFESVYEAALIHELTILGLDTKAQLPLPVHYKGVKLDLGFRIDLLINDKVIIEIKSVETLLNVHKKQLLTYQKLTGKKIGFLVNFNTDYLEDKVSLIRIIN